MAYWGIGIAFLIMFSMLVVFSVQHTEQIDPGEV